MCALNTFQFIIKDLQSNAVNFPLILTQFQNNNSTSYFGIVSKLIMDSSCNFKNKGKAEYRTSKRLL